MTQDNKIISESKTARTPKNKGFSNVLLKLFLVVVVTFVCLMVYKNFQIKSEIAIKKPISNKSDLGKEESILDISDEYKNDPENETTVHDLNIREIK